jgi:hypothetical protein
MIPKEKGSLDKHWDLFESAAIFSCARSILEEHQIENIFGNNENSLEKAQTTTLKFVLFLQFLFDMLLFLIQ